MNTKTAYLRGTLVAAFTTLVGVAHAAQAIEVFRSESCGCCLAWAEHIERGDKHEVKAVAHPDMAKVKAAKGVPADLQSCHTAIVEGYVIEGHVPAADVERLLAERPAGVKGLAVAGMPIGSPGMEHGNHRQPFQVVALGAEGRSVWASYPGSAS